MIANYHTHTKICNHADGYVEEIIEAAIAAGFKVWGFSEHVPFKTIESSSRTTLADFKQLKKDVLEAKAKYQDRIEILFGVECEALDQEKSFYKELKSDKDVDYILFGNHYVSSNRVSNKNYEKEKDVFYYGDSSTPEHLECYCLDAIKGMRWGLFDCLAHPDVFIKGYKKWDAKCEEISWRICKAAKELNIPLALNVHNAFMTSVPKDKTWTIPYPAPEFWEIAKAVGNDVILELDLHTPKVLKLGQIKDVVKYVDDLGLNVLERL